MPYFNAVETFDIIYAHAARDGRGEKLFGDTASFVREILPEAVLNNTFQTVWIEVPLLGAPRFDVAFLLTRESVENPTHIPEALKPFEPIFAWQKGRYPGPCITFSYDTGERKRDTYALSCVQDGIFGDEHGYFAALGRPEAVTGLNRVVSRAPRAWSMWYYAILSGRPGAAMRVDFYVDSERKKAYAENIELFAEDLSRLGFKAVTDTLLERTKRIAVTPYDLELQFDALDNGELLDNIGVSANITAKSPADTVSEFVAEGGPGTLLLDQIAEWGLADDRRRLLGKVACAKRRSLGDFAMTIAIVLRFLKLKWRGGQPLDAKAYYAARAIES